MKLHQQETDSLSTVCQSNDQSESNTDTSKSLLKFRNDKKNLNDDEINSILASCGNDHQKMLNLCKDLLKNSNNSDMKSVLSRYLQGKDSNEERVTDSIKRKAKELNDVSWKPNGYTNLQNINNLNNINIKPPNKTSITNLNSDFIDNNDLVKNEKLKQQFTRRIKFDKQSSNPIKNECIDKNIFAKIDSNGSDSHQCNPLDLSNQTARFNDILI